MAATITIVIKNSTALVYTVFKSSTAASPAPATHPIIRESETGSKSAASSL